ncbi:MAG: DUF488 family protein [Betaproteobacteria bacterium]
MRAERHAKADPPEDAGRARIAFTIGHSTRALPEFIDMLAGHAIETLVDVRTVPRSRHNPQFNGDTLPGALARADVQYAHAPGLGGFRPTRPDSPNGGWRNASFRGYADYMQSSDFADNLFWLMRLAEQQRVALMCAEAVPWRCHRSLIADALLVHGWTVEEIVSATRAQPHRLTPFAHVSGRTITYPAEAPAAQA